MLWAASLIAFFTFCRSGEITVEAEGQYDPNTHLSFGDVAVDNATNPTIISLNIKYSKTDHRRVGSQVVLGKTNDELHPVMALLQYLAGHKGAQGHSFNGNPLSKDKFIEAD